MTYPQPPYPPQQQPAGYPQPGYPVQPQYAPQVQYAPQPQYPQQAQPQYAPQQPPAPAGPPAARATLAEFMDQPTGGGGAAITKFFGGPPPRPQGSWLRMQVQRDLIPSDVEHQKDDAGVLQYFKRNNQPDFSRPKLVLIIRTNLLGSSDPAGAQQVFTDGMASIWLKGVTKDALVAAIGQAGLPNPDKILASGKIGGAVITMVSAGEKPSSKPMYSPTKLYNFTYQPGGREMEAFGEEPVRDPEVVAQYNREAPGFPAPVPPIAPAPVTGAAPVPAAAIPATPPAVAAPPTPPAPAYAQQLPDMTQQYQQQAAQLAQTAGVQYAPPPVPGQSPMPNSYALPPVPGQSPMPNGYALPPVPGQPPLPPVPPAAPGQPPMSAEMQATLARLHGQTQ